MPADGWINVAVLGPASQPILVVSHVEEGLVRVFAAWVPRVSMHLSVLLTLRSLNVPEDVRGQLSESFHCQRLRNACVEGTA